MRCNMRLALYQPDIAGNVGTIMRLCACMGVPLDIVMPCGFPLSDRDLKRAAMDYGGQADATLHRNDADFLAMVEQHRLRLVLMTVRGSAPMPTHRFAPDDIILMGSEGAGVPDHVHDRADIRLRIPMREGFRSLNIAVAAGIALGQALEQTGLYPQ